MAIFGRFTQRAQRAVAAAQQAAVLLHQPYVGTEHILLGLLKEPGPVVADVLPRMSTMIRFLSACARFWARATFSPAACWS